MSIEMSKSKKILFLITILISNIAVMGEMVVLPVINSLYESYWENLTAVNMAVSAPALVMIVASLAASFLLSKISKKTLLIVGGVLFAVCGSLGVAVDNIWYILALRIPYGVGIAFVNVTAVAFIAEVYTEDLKRASIMGLYNAVMAAIGAGMSLSAGFLAVSNWRSAFNTYWSAIPMVILFILFLPSIKPVKSEVKNIDQADEKTSFGRQFWLLIIAFVIFNIVYGFQLMFISTYVAENGLGSEALAGTLSAIGTIGSFLFCLVFGQVYSKIGKNVILLYYSVLALGMLAMWLSPMLAVAYIVVFLSGGAYGSAFSYAYAHSPAIVPASKIDSSIGIVTASYALGMFVTPYLVTIITGMLGEFLITPVMGIGAGILLIAIVLEMINGGLAKKQLQDIS